jgi:hypothetical protein
MLMIWNLNVFQVFCQAVPNKFRDENEEVVNILDDSDSSVMGLVLGNI